MNIQKTAFAIMLGLMINSTSQAGLTMKGSDGNVEKIQTELLGLQAKATVLGFAKNEYELGMAYYDGKLVPRDPLKAAEWLSKASKKTYAPAMFILGKMFLSGDGVQQNAQLGAQLIHSAANKGNSSALAFIEESNKATAASQTVQQVSQNSKTNNGMCSYQDFYIQSFGDREYAQQNGQQVQDSEDYVKGACQIKITYNKNNLVEIYAHLRANNEDYPAYIVTKLNESCDDGSCGISISTGEHQLLEYDIIREYDLKGDALDPDLEQSEAYLKEKIKPNQSYCFQRVFAHSGTVFCMNLGGNTVYQNARAVEN